MSNLPSGLYFILNQGKYAGRWLIEDRSLLPKGVFCPTNDQKPLVRHFDVIVFTLIQFEQFEIENLGNGHYIIRAHGDPTAAIDNFVFAILLPDPPPEEWNITKVWNGQYLSVPFDFQSGQALMICFNAYSIETLNKSGGWTAQPVDEPRVRIFFLDFWSSHLHLHTISSRSRCARSFPHQASRRATFLPKLGSLSLLND
jgi:hypothetical protein